MKVKNIKAKVAAKVAKGKAKVAAKAKGGKACKKCAPAALALVIGAVALLDGCQGLTSPSRSQTLTMKDCNVYIIGSGDGTTNDVARVDIASQAMSIENSGTETQTSTPTQTTDVKPDIDVAYNDAIAGATAASKGVLETLTDAGAQAVLRMMAGKQTGVVTVPTKDGGTMAVKCEGGQCSECSDCTP